MNNDAVSVLCLPLLAAVTIGLVAWAARGEYSWRFRLCCLVVIGWIIGLMVFMAWKHLAVTRSTAPACTEVQCSFDQEYLE